MGAYMSCSHSRVEVLTIEPDHYKSPDNVWLVQAGDGRCRDCNENIRIIKKTCLEHGIQQPWEATNIHVCQHDHVAIKNKTKDESNNRYNARLECVFCKISSPVYCTFIIKQSNGKSLEFLTSDWTSDKKQLAIELEANKNKK